MPVKMLKWVTLLAIISVLLSSSFLGIAVYTLHTHQARFSFLPLVALFGYVTSVMLIDVGMVLSGLYESSTRTARFVIIITTTAGLAVNLLIASFFFFICRRISTPPNGEPLPPAAMWRLDVSFFSSAVLFTPVQVWVMLVNYNSSMIGELAREEAESERLYLLLDDKQTNYKALADGPDSMFQKVPPLS